MPIDIPEEIWKDIQSKIDMYVSFENGIGRISVEIEDCGVRIHVTEEIPSEENWDYEYNDDDFFIRDSTSEWIRKRIFQTLDNEFSDSVNLSFDNVGRISIEENKMNFTYELSTTFHDSDFHDELTRTLRELDYIDTSENFGYGTLKIHDSTFGDGYDVDGTLYRLTEEPYRYWRESEDSEYPTNMEEWIEFAGDSEEEKKRIRERDKHLIHFHPSEYNVGEENPLISLYLDYERIFRSVFPVSEESMAQVNLWRISVDNPTVHCLGGIVI